MKKISIGELELVGSGVREIDDIIISLPVNRTSRKESCDLGVLVLLSHNRIISGHIGLEVARSQGFEYVYVDHMQTPRMPLIYRQWDELLSESMNCTPEIQMHVLTAIFQPEHNLDWFQKRGLLVNERPITQAMVASCLGISPQTLNARIKKFTNN